MPGVIISSVLFRSLVELKESFSILFARNITVISDNATLYIDITHPFHVRNLLYKPKVLKGKQGSSD